jgi:hypothetical protein
MRSVCCICAFMLGLAADAQRPVTYTVKAGVEVRDVVPMNEIFQYPQFVQGLVVFKDGTSAPGRLNYNRMIAEIMFIDGKGDTLTLDNAKTIKTATIGNDTFYYSDGYVRQLTGGTKIKAGERVAFKEYINKPGAYGLSSATTATNNLAVLLNKRSLDLNISQEIVLVKNTNMMIGDRFNSFVPVERKTVLRMFSDNKSAIEDFLERNKISFNKREDVVELVKFLQTL